MINLATPADDEFFSLGREMFVSGRTEGTFVDFSFSSLGRTKGDGRFELTCGGKSCDSLLASGGNFVTSFPASGVEVGDAGRCSASFWGCVALVAFSFFLV